MGKYCKDEDGKDSGNDVKSRWLIATAPDD